MKSNSSLLQRTALQLMFLGVASLVLVPAASAAAQVQADLTSTQVTARGPHDVVGELSILLQEERPHEVGILNAIPGFEMVASKIRLETDYTENVIRSPDGGSDIIVRGGPLNNDQSPEDFTHATVTGLENRPGYRMMVLRNDTAPAPSVHFESSCTTINPSDTNEITKAALASNRSAFEENTDSSLLWSTCNDEEATITVEGNFLLVLWDWDATLSAQNETPIPLQNGYREHPATGSTDTVASSREHYLYVEGASLRVPATSNAYRLYTSTTQVQTGSSAAKLAFSNAQGTMVTPLEEISLFGDHTFYLQGEVSLHAEGSHAGAPFDTESSGEAYGVKVGPESVPVPTILPAIQFRDLTFVPVIGALVLAAVIFGLIQLYAVPQGVYNRLASMNSGYVDEDSSTSRRFRRAAVYYAWANVAYGKKSLRRARWWATWANRLRADCTAYLALKDQVDQELRSTKLA